MPLAKEVQMMFSEDLTFGNAKTLYLLKIFRKFIYNLLELEL
jgi:hypothetical protein